MLFEIVGVELNEARNEKIAFKINGIGNGAWPFSDVLDQTTSNGHGPVKDAIRQNQPGVGDEHFGHDFSILVDEPPLPPHGAD